MKTCLYAGILSVLFCSTALAQPAGIIHTTWEQNVDNVETTIYSTIGESVKLQVYVPYTFDNSNHGVAALYKISWIWVDSYNNVVQGVQSDADSVPANGDGGGIVESEFLLPQSPDTIKYRCLIAIFVQFLANSI